MRLLIRLRITHEDAMKSLFSVRWKLAIASKLKRETSVTNQWLLCN